MYSLWGKNALQIQLKIMFFFFFGNARESFMLKVYCFCFDFWQIALNPIRVHMTKNITIITHLPQQVAVCESDARVSLGCGVSLRSVQLRGLQIVSHRLRSVLQSLVGRGQVKLQVCDPLASLARLCARQDIQPLLRLARLHVRRTQIKRTGALQSLLSELKTRANQEALLCV